MSENNNGNQGGQKPTLSWSQPANTSGSKPSTQATPAASSFTPPQPQSKPVAAAPVAPTSNTGMYVGIFVAGLIVGAAVGWSLTSSSGSSKTADTSDTAATATSTMLMASSTPTSTDSTTTTSTTNTPAVTSDSDTQTGSMSNDAITVAPSQVAGFNVAVSKINVTQPTWLVVYEDHNGTPGNAIGAGLFFAGATSGTIELLRATLPGQTYLVGQSLDDGDKVFSLTTDKPVRDAEGNPLFTTFTAK